jgi:hypothetical protein
MEHGQLFVMFLPAFFLLLAFLFLYGASHSAWAQEGRRVGHLGGFSWAE